VKAEIGRSASNAPQFPADDAMLISDMSLTTDPGQLGPLLHEFRVAHICEAYVSDTPDDAPERIMTRVWMVPLRCRTTTSSWFDV
jgi:hypothetical protein